MALPKQEEYIDGDGWNLVQSTAVDTDFSCCELLIMTYLILFKKNKTIVIELFFS